MCIPAAQRDMFAFTMDNASPDKTLPQRKHLRRLERIYTANVPIYFLTVCVQDRLPLLAAPQPVEILTSAWQHAEELYSWLIGRYVIMPDHVHFFATPSDDTARSLSGFMGYWKRSVQKRLRILDPIFSWQAEFFDHLLRNEEAYEQKWNYIKENPVRAGLVAASNDWPYQGEINIIRW